MSSLLGKFLETHQGNKEARGYNDRRILAQILQFISTIIVPELHYFIS
jgi:hypothetical protein